MNAPNLDDLKAAAEKYPNVVTYLLLGTDADYLRHLILDHFDLDHDDADIPY